MFNQRLAFLFTSFLASTSAFGAGPTDDVGHRTALWRQLVESRPDLKVTWPAERASPSFVAGRLRDADPRQAQLITSDFLRENSELFGLDTDRELDLTNPRVSVDRDSGWTDVTVQQVLRGHPVRGARTRVHLDRDGAVRVVHGRLEPGLDELLVPAVPLVPADALPFVLRGALSLATTPVLGDEPRLEVVLIEGRPMLAWRIVAMPEAEIVEYWIDAVLGLVLDSKSMANHAKEEIGSGRDPFGDTHVIYTTRRYFLGAAVSDYRLDDKTRKARIRGYDQDGGTRFSIWDLETDSDNYWAASWQESEVSGHRNAGRVLDYFDDAHGRDSYNDSGGSLKMGYHAKFEDDDGSLHERNATSIGAFLGTAYFMFGDGDDLPFTSLDIVAHEFTHAMLHDIGVDTDTDQSDALHESIADCFGVFCERSLNNSSGSWNFHIGEETFTQSDYVNPSRSIRDLASTRHIFDYDAKSSEHTNSRIPSHAMFLAWQGGTHGDSGGIVGGSGYVAMRKIYYKALSYLGSNPSFYDMRLALRSAAEELYGELTTPWKAIGTAYNAIGVIDGDWNLAKAADDFDIWQVEADDDVIGLEFGDLTKNLAIGFLTAELEDGSDVTNALAFKDVATTEIVGSIPVQLPPKTLFLKQYLKIQVGFPSSAGAGSTAQITIRFDALDSVASASWTKLITKDGTVDSGTISLNSLAGQRGTISIRVNASHFTGPIVFPQLELVKQ